MMRLIGVYDSPFVRRVAISMRVLGIEYRHEPLSAYRDVERYRGLNPVVRSPTAVFDTGETMWESNFILDALDEMAGERRLVPASGAPRRHAHARIAMALSAAEKAATLVSETVRRPSEVHHAPSIERARWQVHAALLSLEQSSDWAGMAREALTQVGITAAVALRFVQHVDASLVDTGACPGLVAFSAACEERPEFVATRFG